ncbi:MAG: hypothetical protein CMH57_15445 [Myxococcales bacterium]|nr:hypothetical protein [Myxococcales bacterium]
MALCAALLLTTGCGDESDTRPDGVRYSGLNGLGEAPDGDGLGLGEGPGVGSIGLGEGPSIGAPNSASVGGGGGGGGGSTSGGGSTPGGGGPSGGANCDDACDIVVECFQGQVSAGECASLCAQSSDSDIECVINNSNDCGAVSACFN